MRKAAPAVPFEGGTFQRIRNSWVDIGLTPDPNPELEAFVDSADLRFATQEISDSYDRMMGVLWFLQDEYPVEFNSLQELRDIYPDIEGNESEFREAKHRFEEWRINKT